MVNEDQSNTEPTDLNHVIDDERQNERLRTRLDDIQQGYILWSRRSLIILAVIALIALGGGLTSAALYWRIQNAREDACEQRNLRHDNAVASLRKDAAEDQDNAPTPAAKTEIARRRDVTIRLIDFLQPHTPNCNDA